MRKYLLGIDVGTTGSKAIIFDLEGKAICSAYREYVCIYPRSNWVEQDSQMLKEAVIEVCNEVMKKAGTCEIASISISAQRCCALFIDENGEVLKMISWLDNRASDEVEEIKLKYGAEEFYAVSGMPLGTTWLLPKILWVRKNLPGIFKQTVKIVQLHDYILKCLGAQDYYSDEPDSAFWGFWNTDELIWQADMLEKFDIDEKLLPIIKPSGTLIGAIDDQTAKLTGIKSGTPLCVGAGDQNCAAIGAGVVRKGTASVSLGTGGLATVFLEKPARDPLGKTMFTNSPVQGGWQMEGLQNGAAGVFRWFRDEIANWEKFKAERDSTDPYKLINELIESAPVGAKGIVFLPYLASAATPRYDEYARGTLIGLTFSHSRADIARSMIEGVTMEQKDILNAITGTGIRLDTVRIMGGATKSDVWNQVQADMYGAKVETLEITDAAVLGAAICAAVGVGLFSDIKAAANALVKTSKSYLPIEKNVQTYNELYEVYVKAYEALAPSVFKDLSEIQSRVI